MPILTYTGKSMGKKKRTDYKLQAFVIIVVVAAMVIFLFGNKSEDEIKSVEKATEETVIVREPAVAGTFYASDKKELESDIKKYLDNAEKTIEGNVRGLILPHAGYVYSGQCAAYGVKQIEGKEYKTAIIMGPSHHAYFRGASVANATHYRTPLGDARISEKTKSIISDLKDAKLFANDERIHESEHSVEVEIPFIQYALEDTEIVPIVIGAGTSYDELVKIGEIIKKYLDDETFVVVSSDFTHYGSRFGFVPFTDNLEENIKNLDYGAIEYIEKVDAKGFYDYVKKTGATICGELPITILLSLFDSSDTKAKLVNYDTSGRMTGDYENSVSYASIVLWKEDDDMSGDELNKEEQEFLLRLARDTLELYLKEKKTPELNPKEVPEKLKNVQGGFVTLHKKGNLRGCIGHIIPQEPLYKCIMDNAINAALHDTRFPPVTYDELKDIDIEISVLTVPKKLEYSSPDDLLEKLAPLKDGVVLKSGWRQSTFLPQVWEQLPDKVEFLEHLCLKQGSSSDCWKNPDTVVEIYHAQVFGEI